MQNSLLARVGEAVWGWPMMALFLGTGIWYMLRLRGLPLRRLADLPFMMPSEEMSYYPVLQQLFQHAGVHPKVIFQSSNTNILYQMVCNGYGAAIVPRRCFSPRDPVSPFSLRPRLYNYACLVFRSGAEKTAAWNYLLELLSI